MKDYILIIAGSDIDYFYDVEDFLKEGEAGIAIPEDKKVGGCVLNVGQVLSGFNNDVKVLDYLNEDDEDTDLLLESMKKGNLDIDNVKYGKNIQNGKCLIMRKQGEKCIYIIPSVHPQYDLNEVNDLLFNSKLIYTLPHTYISSFGHNEELLIELKRNAVLIAFDGESQYQDKEELNILKYADYLFMNKSAYLRLEKLLNSNPNEFLFNNGLEILCITDGSKGVDLYTKNDKYHVDAIKLDKVIDSTGAGDTFAATFINEYLKNKDISNSLRIANYAAARACLFEGGLGGVTSKKELENFINNNK